MSAEVALKIPADAAGLADLKQRAAILLTRGDLEETRSLVDEALVGLPEDSDLLALRGTCRARQGELSDGIQDLASAVMLNPRDWELLNNLAVHLQQMKMFDEAVVFTSRRSTIPSPSIIPSFISTWVWR